MRGLTVRSVDPQMLIQARRAAGLTQKDLADQVDVSQALLSKVESGVREADPDLTQKLSRVLLVTPDVLCTQLSRFGTPISYHRSRKTVGRRVVGKLEAQFNLIRIHINRVIDSAEPDFPLELPIIEPNPERGGAAEVARQVRRRLSIPPGPIKNLIQILEDAGVFVFRFDFGTDGVDGVSFHVPGEQAFIFLNAQNSGARQRMTAAHEMGHLVMHLRNRDPNTMEDEANAFASEFLAPEEEIRGSLRNLTWEKAMRLKPYWRISMKALVHRANAAKAITPGRARRLYIRLAPYKKEEPCPIMPERVTLARELTAFLADDLGYTDAELSSALGVIGRRFVFFTGRAPKLRAVGS